jgi:preprotein translocase subunit YajC
VTLQLLTLLVLQGESRGPGMSIFLLQMLAFVAIIYFLMIRPKVQQEKKHRERLKQLRRGDDIVTAGGIVGKITELRDDRLTIKSGESRFIIVRDRVAEVITRGEEKR